MENTALNPNIEPVVPVTYRPTSNPTPQASPAPTPIPPTPKTNNALVIILMILLVTAIGAGSYYFLQYQKLTSAPPPAPQNTGINESPAPSTAPDATADWRTYTNNNLKFSFSYPPEFTPTDNLQTSLDPSEWTTKKTLTLKNSTNSCAITLLVNPDGFGPFFPNKTLVLNYSNSTGFSISKETLSSANGNDEANLDPDMYQIIFTNAKEINSSIKAVWGSAVCPNNSESIEYIEDVTPQILSTFKFTNSSKSLSPAPTGSKRFTSEKLGVTFYYQEKQGDETFSAKEIGNKIYVHSNISPPDQGQYLEVFEKTASDTLVDAIKKTILAGFSQTDCKIDLNASGFSSSIINPAFESAQLTVEVEGEWDMDKASQKASNCPTKYMALGGLNYFLSDPNYPTKFIFVSIGQYAIQGDSQKLWQDTLEFIN